jgi:hypothetical protein
MVEISVLLLLWFDVGWSMSTVTRAQDDDSWEDGGEDVVVVEAFVARVSWFHSISAMT